MKPISRIALAAVFSAALAGVGTAAMTAEEESFRRVETTSDCADVAWPRIPAACLQGDGHENVRLITTDRQSTQDAIASRFASAFDKS
jgi:hypothetical protein